MVPKYTEYFLIQRIAKRNRQQQLTLEQQTRVVYIAGDTLRHQPMGSRSHDSVLVMQAYRIRILPWCYI